MEVLLNLDQLDNKKPIAIYGCGGLSRKLLDCLKSSGLAQNISFFLDSFDKGTHEGLPLKKAEDALRNWPQGTQLILASSHGDTQRLVEVYLSQNYLKYDGADRLNQRSDFTLSDFNESISRLDWLKAATIANLLTSEQRPTARSSLAQAIDSEIRTPPYSMNIFEDLFRLKVDGSVESSNDYYPDLIIYDRIFPSPHCSFALQEFDAYLQAFPNSKAILTGTDLISSGDEYAFEKYRASYCDDHSINPDRLELITSKTSFKAKHFYTLFLRGIYGVLDILEKEETPFSFTLYSGGEYGLNWPDSDRKLKRVLDSPFFSHVIVVEPVTRDYLINRFSVPPGKIKFIFGPITSADSIGKLKITNRRWGFEKETFDICFVANKHMPDGRDKGWDHFLEVAKLLSCKTQDFRFHAVGGFDSNDLGANKELPITFYGHQPDSFFSSFHEHMDVILSPCRPFILAPGAFDGAPNVCTAEAGLHGVAVFVTDQLEQNQHCESGKNIIFIDEDPNKTADTLLEFHSNPDSLKTLGENCRNRFREIYSRPSQIEPRIHILKDSIHND